MFNSSIKFFSYSLNPLKSQTITATSVLFKIFFVFSIRFAPSSLSSSIPPESCPASAAQLVVHQLAGRGVRQLVYQMVFARPFV